MYSIGKDWRERQNINMFDPRRHKEHQKEMNHTFGEDILKKNLADTIITGENKQNSTKTKTFLITTMEPPKMEQTPPTFGGITSFFSGVFSVITGAMSHWRPKSPVQYYDCFDDDSQGAPLPWHLSNNEVQNKSVRDIHSNSKSDMNIDCKTAAAQCEDKLNKVRLLLTTKSTEPPKSKPRRPKKVFVEAGSVEDSFEDAFSTDSDFISIANTPFIEYYSQYQNQSEDMLETASPNIKVEKNVPCDTDIIKVLPEVSIKSEVVVKEPISDKDQKPEMELEKKTENSNIEKTCREELILSCEDKLSKLKALLQEKRKKKTTRSPSPDSVPETMVKSNENHVKLNDKIKDKHYKNPNRKTDKRKKAQLKKSIQDDLLFAQEIDCVELLSAENSSVNSLDRLSDSGDPIQTTVASNDPVDYFDEVSGRFRSTSTTESEDSFQIVFSDSPKETKPRRVSDCDSEDSFIVFEESPDSCYTSNDVFGDSDESDGECTDSEVDMSDTDDVQVTKLSHSMSRTLSDLTDGSLYEENSMDEVDCAVRRVCDEIPSSEISDMSEKVSDTNCELKSTGLLLNDERKMLKRKLPAKSVRFSSEPPKVHVMRVWAFAARQARAGHWERCALDRDRFKRRIADVDMAVSWVLQPRHRARVMFQRFMPWWNAQKRKELAEKKAKEEEEKAKKQEEEKIRLEAEQSQVNGNNEDCDGVNDKHVALNDEGQKQGGIELINDTDKIDIVKQQLNVKVNGFVEVPVKNKSFLNDDSVKNVVINDKHNDYTSKLRSGGLSNT